MSDTIRKQIIAALATKLEVITTDNGFNTSIGSNVEKVLGSIDPGDVPACVIWPGDEQADQDFGYVVATMPIKIEGITTLGSNNASDMVEKILGDLIEAVSGHAWTVPYTSGGTTEIEAGDTITGATSGATGYVMSVTLSTGTWAGGDAAGNLTIRRKSGDFEAENLLVSAVNCATTTGSLTYISAIESTTNSLAEGIEYSAGGAGEYPESKDIVVGGYATFNFKYRYLVGNPYSQ